VRRKSLLCHPSLLTVMLIVDYSGTELSKHSIIMLSVVNSLGLYVSEIFSGLFGTDVVWNSKNIQTTI
jgi:hypothetical protein